MFETPESRVLLMLHEMQQDLRDLRGQLDKCFVEMSARIEEANGRIEDLARKIAEE